MIQWYFLLWIKCKVINKMWLCFVIYYNLWKTYFLKLCFILDVVSVTTTVPHSSKTPQLETFYEVIIGKSPHHDDFVYDDNEIIIKDDKEVIPRREYGQDYVDITYDDEHILEQQYHGIMFNFFTIRLSGFM